MNTFKPGTIVEDLYDKDDQRYGIVVTHKQAVALWGIDLVGKETENYVWATWGHTISKAKESPTILRCPADRLRAVTGYKRNLPEWF